MEPVPGIKKNNIDFKLAKLNQRTTIIISTITVLTSFVGSIIVAIIVGNLTIKSSVDAVHLSNQSQEKLLQKTIESQLAIASTANENQLQISLKTLENNQLISENTLKNTLNIIERDNELKIKTQIENEKREKQARKTLALNYFLSEISTRTIYMESALNGFSPLLEEISKSSNSNKSSLRIISELEMKQHISSQELFSWPVSKDINNYLVYLKPESQKNILLFYRSVEIFSNISAATNSDELKEFKKDLKDLVTSQITSDYEKRLAIEIYKTSISVNFNGAKSMLRNIVIIGLKNIIMLQNRLKMNNDVFQEKLSNYLNNPTNTDKAYMSSMNSLLEQVDKVQTEVLDSTQEKSKIKVTH